MTITLFPGILEVLEVLEFPGVLENLEVLENLGNLGLHD